MARTINQALQVELQASSSTVFVVTMLRVTSPDLENVYCVCDDVVNYMYNGELYFGMPFAISTLTDNDSAPTAQLTLIDVDRRIGKSIRACITSPKLSITLLNCADFTDALSDSGFVDDDGNIILAKFPIGLVVPAYTAKLLELRQVAGNNSSVTANIVSFDTTSEPWPGIRTRKSNTPGLFR